MADVALNLNIPDAYVTRAVDAFKGLAGKRIEMMAHGEDFNGNWSFQIAPKTGAEDMKQFGTRFFRELGLAAIRMWDYAEDQDRYRDEVRTITPASQDVPDGAIEDL